MTDAPHRYYREAVSATLARLVNTQKSDTISLDELADALQEKGLAFFLMVLAIPTMAPVAPPGFSMTLSLPQFFLAFQIAFGRRRLWLPKWLGKKRIKTSSLRYVVEKALPLLKWLEARVKPRLLYMSTRYAEKLIGWVCVVCCVSVLAPIPFSNSTPSFGMVLMALGFLERDGVVIKAGMLVSAIGLGITCGMVLLGAEAASFGLDMFWK